MATTTLLVDGLLSGTGLRDAIKGGYIMPISLGISTGLVTAFAEWVAEYERAHFQDYNDADVIASLDVRGMALAARLALERPDQTVGYYSSALLERLGDLPHA